MIATTMIATEAIGPHRGGVEIMLCRNALLRKFRETVSRPPEFRLDTYKPRPTPMIITCYTRDLQPTPR